MSDRTVVRVSPDSMKKIRMVKDTLHCEMGEAVDHLISIAPEGKAYAGAQEGERAIVRVSAASAKKLDDSRVMDGIATMGDAADHLIREAEFDVDAPAAQALKGEGPPGSSPKAKKAAKPKGEKKPKEKKAPKVKAAKTPKVKKAPKPKAEKKPRAKKVAKEKEVKPEIPRSKADLGKLTAREDHWNLVKEYAEHAGITVQASFDRIMHMGYVRHFAMADYTAKLKSGEKKPKSKAKKRAKKG